MRTFDVKAFDVQKYDAIISRGLSKGLGDRDGGMCIEAAICTVLGLPHGDDPKCVAQSVRSFKIRLNDSDWSSSEARAAGLRSLGLAQLGSLGVVDDAAFCRRMAERTTRVLIPKLFRELFPDDPACLEAAEKCETVPCAESAYEAHRAAWAAIAWTNRTSWAAEAAKFAAAGGWSARAGYCAAKAAANYKAADEYLLLSASLALEVLRELGSPGCELLEGGLKT